MDKGWILVGEVVAGLLLAGILAPFTLFVLPESAQGPGALVVVGVASIALVIAAHRYITRRKA